MKYLLRRMMTALFLSFCVMEPGSDTTPQLSPVGTHIRWPEAIDQGNGNVGLVERGILYVPANRESPEGNSLALSYWRFKKTGEPSPNQPPIFVLEGGPGFLGYNRGAAGY